MLDLRRTVVFSAVFCCALLGCQRQAVSPSASGSPTPARPGFQAAFLGRDPTLRWDGSGNLHLVYVEDRAEGAAVVYRRLGADPAGPVTVSPAHLSAAVDSETPPILELLPDGGLLTGYPVERPGRWRSEIRVQRSPDGGKTWSEARLVHPPRDGTHSYLSSAALPSGEVALAWLDDRAGQMGLYAASTRDGETFSSAQTLDPQTCECCGTELLAGRGGTAWLAYRDLEAGDIRDFRILRSLSAPPSFHQGAKLSADRWRLQGCPDTGARLAEAADGTLWAAWFTAGGQSGVYVTSSRDGGVSFAGRTLLTAPDRLARHPEIGTLPDGRVAVLYESVEPDGSHPILARLLDAGGKWGPLRKLAPQGVYPRLAVAGDRTAVALTCGAAERTRVVVAEWADIEAGTADWTACEDRPEPR